MFETGTNGINTVKFFGFLNEILLARIRKRVVSVTLVAHGNNPGK